MNYMAQNAGGSMALSMSEKRHCEKRMMMWKGKMCWHETSFNHQGEGRWTQPSL